MDICKGVGHGLSRISGRYTNKNDLGLKHQSSCRSNVLPGQIKLTLRKKVKGGEANRMVEGIKPLTCATVKSLLILYVFCAFTPPNSLAGRANVTTLTTGSTEKEILIK